MSWGGPRCGALDARGILDIGRRRRIARDVRDRPAVCGPQGPRLCGRVSGGLHLRGQSDALHPPGRVCRLWCVRAGLPGRGDLLRGRHSGGVEGLLRRQCRLLRRSRVARWRRQARRDRQGPPDDRRAAAAESGMTQPSRGHVSVRFPEFPWDTLTAAKQRASTHPGGLVDLSIGTPVDPSPDVAREALIAAANAPGYPAVYGTEPLRQAAVDWIERRFEVTGLSSSQVLPTIGSKEFIANLPTQLGLTAGDLVVVPELAYPTYEVGARYAGCEVLAADSTVAIGPKVPAIVYL